MEKKWQIGRLHSGREGFSEMKNNHPCPIAKLSTVIGLCYPSCCEKLNVRELPAEILNWHLHPLCISSLKGPRAVCPGQQVPILLPTLFPRSQRHHPALRHQTRKHVYIGHPSSTLDPSSSNDKSLQKHQVSNKTSWTGFSFKLYVKDLHTIDHSRKLFFVAAYGDTNMKPGYLQGKSGKFSVPIEKVGRIHLEFK